MWFLLHVYLSLSTKIARQTLECMGATISNIICNRILSIFSVTYVVEKRKRKMGEDTHHACSFLSYQHQMIVKFWSEYSINEAEKCCLMKKKKRKCIKRKDGKRSTGGIERANDDCVACYVGGKVT